MIITFTLQLGLAISDSNTQLMAGKWVELNPAEILGQLSAYS